ncbi:MAG: AAA family ATPase, partial [Bacteroidales bacterium]|nr:AAA family ATPase [Bacteroidales bacterium]
MKKLPIGIQSFKSLREDDFLYVDKTRLLYTLAKEAKYYFLSRPRRFGKSLLLSTLKAYFQGKRELFEGLAIAELEKDWNSYPILYLDLNVGLYTSVEGLIAALDSNLSLWEQEYGLQKPNSDVAQRFKNVILSVSKKEGKQVVVLVDEYDKPLLQVIDNESLLAEYRNILKGFYSNLKTCDEHIRFAFLTGVTKFSHVSIFSDLNNLQDISLNNAYADIC